MKTLSTLALVTLLGICSSTFAQTPGASRPGNFFAGSNSTANSQANAGLRFAPPQQNTNALGSFQPSPSNSQYAPANSQYAPPSNQYAPQNVSYTPSNAYQPVGYQPQQPQPQTYQPPQASYSPVKLGFLGTMLYGQGLRVDSVNPGSTAENLGLKSGDLLTHINGQQIMSFDHYLQLLEDSVSTLNGRIELRYDNGRRCSSPFTTITFRLGGPISGQG